MGLRSILSKNGWNLFVKVAVPRPVDQAYDYSWSLDQANGITPRPGLWVKVPLGRAQVVGCVLEVFTDPPRVPEGIKIKSVLEVMNEGFEVPSVLQKLAAFAAEYYQYPLGEAYQVIAPPKIAQPIRPPKKKEKALPPLVDRKLNDEQMGVHQKLLEMLNSNAPKPCLLEGVTGSGKTEIYLEVAKEVLSRGHSVLILVPEIALTAQLRDRFEHGLGCSVVLWHSAVSDGLRQHQWLESNRGEVKVIVGARSAIFAPLKNIGLIVVDEEHDQTYKQEERFRYQARDLALFRGNLEKALVLLGSATPSLETLHRVQQGKCTHLLLKQRHSRAKMPVLKFVSLKDELCVDESKSKTPFALKTIEEMQSTLDRGEQVIVFLNRRGFSQFLMCKDCGWVKECSDCSISMTHYQGRRELKCHVCGKKEAIPHACESCHSHELVGMGSGTESLEEDLQRVLNDARVGRLDRDAITSQKRLEQLLQDFRDLKFNVLVGTQMLVKGHDFPKVTCVVVVSTDSILRFPDFRSAERALQTLIQVSGRSGRADIAGQVLLQGYDLDHEVIQVLQGVRSVDEFRKNELETREALQYPPFSRMVRFRFSDAQENRLKQQVGALMNRLEQLEVYTQWPERWLGPSEALLFRAHQEYRYDLYFKAGRVEDLIRASQTVKKMAHEFEMDLTVDVDPYHS